jgi:hypothetical protein
LESAGEHAAAATARAVAAPRMSRLREVEDTGLPFMARR